MQQSNQSNQPPTSLQDAVWAGHLMLTVARMVAHPMELITRRWGTMGRGYPHPVVALTSVFLVPVVATVLVPPPYGGGWMVLFPFGLILLSGCHNVRRAFRGRHIHREYVGDPWWWGRGHRGSEIVFGLLASFFGLVLCPTLGLLLLASLGCSVLNLHLIEVRDRRIVDQMRDSQLDAEYYAARLRGGG